MIKEVEVILKYFYYNEQHYGFAFPVLEMVKLPVIKIILFFSASA
jgi:hypothetical protein